MSLPFASVGEGLDAQEGFFFPDRATIKTVTSTFDDQGTEERSPTVLATDVPAQLTEASRTGAGGELRTGEGSFVLREDQIILRGWRPEIDEASLIEIAGRTFHVRGVLKESWGIALADKGWTICHVEERES